MHSVNRRLLSLEQGLVAVLVRTPESHHETAVGKDALDTSGVSVSPQCKLESGR